MKITNQKQHSSKRWNVVKIGRAVGQHRATLTDFLTGDEFSPQRVNRRTSEADVSLRENGRCRQSVVDGPVKNREQGASDSKRTSTVTQTVEEVERWRGKRREGLVGLRTGRSGKANGERGEVNTKNASCFDTRERCTIGVRVYTRP